MAFSPEMVALIDERIREALTTETAAATVVTRTGNTTANVIFDGSALAVPVKVFGDVNVDAGDRVGLLRIGTDWTIIGAFTRRRSITMPDGATTGQQRTVFGAGTPPEVAAFGVEVSILFYVTDVVSGLEAGYFFIGQSNAADAPPPGWRVLAIGNVTYPTPGVPTSATVADVKCNLQFGMWGTGGTRATVFKDHDVEFWTPAGAPAPPRINMFDEIDNTRHRITPMSQGGISNASATDSTSSTTNVPINDFAWPFRKNYDDTAVKLTLSMGAFSSTGNADVRAGINLNGTDYEITGFFFNQVNIHAAVPSGYTYVFGVPAGTYTPYIWWRRNTGTGNIQRSAGDWVSGHTEEVAV